MKVKDNMSLYVVEVERFSGTPRQVYGVFRQPRERIIEMMREYNEERGGKYPCIFLTQVKLGEPHLHTTEKIEVGRTSF